ncbi:type II toxin-antitoxin system RelE/ParE family toxin [uncultured Tateyamaria sp.]|uniref:type II toxin-antitoxin system RelE/ParE family toxin n=1 Tax=Tateyamaria sp. 1078 TaxID=3417464 RepID=UPI002605CA41|nr:type II toxin-antitoxin system RelE/ParE family toxin [uncultured Tateyamaria sp.]
MPTDYKVLRSAACDADIEIIFDHLFGAYRDLGEPIADALTRAAARVRGIEDALARLGDVPFQGTLVPHIMDGLRHVTKDSAVFYFVTDEARAEVRVLGVFFGGQDHRRHILQRILHVSTK